MFWQQLRLAWIPLVIFLACAATAVWNRGTSKGSAVGGYEKAGRYFLSMGHGGYRETDAAEFATIRRREKVVLYCLGGMLVSGVAAGWLVKRAGMPLHASDIRRE